jgi:tetratricopeptide (TPR) repeat protein
MTPDVDRSPKRPAAAAALAAVLVTLAVFAPAVGNGFIDLYDDGPYLLDNAVVKRGLTLEGIGWAFTRAHSNNWHPLTWMSHMLDVELFGLDPRGHHLGNVLLHAANAGLVVLLLVSLGLGPVTAALAGLAFGVHPLRVQSVAWVAERKDVLSALFGLLTLLAYLRWARRPTKGGYLAALGLFVLGLLSKPMLVTLPAVMLLLDWWPLDRLGTRAAGEGGWRRVVVEKLPFFGLATLAVIPTLLAQRAATAQGGRWPIGIRLGNAAVSAVSYLGKLAWPRDLAVFYPHPGEGLSTVAAVAAAAALAVITVAAILFARRAAWLLMGWLWYLGMLLPVSGILQAGAQGMADRYTYLPAIGLLLVLAAGAEALLRRVPARQLRFALGGAALLAVAALALATRAEVEVWRDSRTLFRRAYAVTGPNAVAANALGILAAREGRLDEALRLYQEAVAADPDFAVARQNLAAILLATGRGAEALPHAAAAVRLDPRNPQSRYVLGGALESRGLLPEAASEYEAALALAPGYERARQRLAVVRAALEQRQH